MTVVAADMAVTVGVIELTARLSWSQILPSYTGILVDDFPRTGLKDCKSDNSMGSANMHTSLPVQTIPDK